MASVTKTALAKLTSFKRGEEEEEGKAIEKIAQEDGKLTETPASREVAEAVATADPLDSADFNPLDYINRLFPNEQSLVNIDKVLGRLRIRIRKLDTEIRDVVRSQTSAGEEGKRELEEAKKGINELFSKIEQIRTKAEESEVMVQEITKDIKSLDYAKRHLTTSITTLRKLNMLVTATEQLKVMSQKKQYREAAHLLQAVQQLVLFFKDYKQIKKIQELSDSVASIQVDLKRQILGDFTMSFNSTGELAAGRSAILVEACELANILGPEVKKQIEQLYCDNILQDYKGNFHPSSEAGSLDKSNLRFTWLNRTLTARDADAKEVFPEDWRILESLAVAFTTQTSQDFTALLTKAERTDSMDVKLVLATLQKTLEFENKLANKFAIVRTEEERQDDNADDDETPEDQKPSDNAEVIKNKYKKYLAEKKRNEKMMEKLQKKPVKTLPPVPNPRFFGSISGSFEPYLVLYINAEEEKLQELMTRIKTQQESPDEDNYVLNSSTDLFFFYKESLKRCSKISTRRVLLDLAKVFGKYLMNYKEILGSKIPPEGELKKGFANQDAKMVSMILNTADYCHTTIEQLESKIREKIDPMLADKVDFTDPKESFLNLITDAMKALVTGMIGACSIPFAAMTKIPWNAIESVGDQSKYVTEICTILTTKIQIIRNTIQSEKYFKNYSNKLVEAFSGKLVSNIYKCKPISEVGAEQMLLDTQAMKSNLLAMMVVRGPGQEASGPPQTFVKLVAKEMSKPESILKVVLSHVDPPEALVENYIFLFANTDLANFQNILDLKGLKKNEQQQVIEVFRTHLPSTPSGESSVTGSVREPTVSQTLDAAFQPARQLNNALRKTMNMNNVISGLKIKNNPASNPFGGNPFQFRTGGGNQGESGTGTPPPASSKTTNN